MLIHLPKSITSKFKHKNSKNILTFIELWDKKKNRQNEFWKFVLNMWLFAFLTFTTRVGLISFFALQKNFDSVMGIPVYLPIAYSAKTIVHKKNEPNIFLNDRNLLLFNDRIVEIDELHLELKKILKEKPNIRIRLSID